MPLVTAQESSEIISLLSNQDQTFEELGHSFRQNWSSAPSDTLRALFSVLLFLQEGAIKQGCQRLSALHLLHDLTRLQPVGRNPFTPFLVQAVQEPDRHFPERLFIHRLLVEDGSPSGSISSVLHQLRQVKPQPLPPAPEIWKVIHQREEERLGKAGAESKHEVEAMLAAAVRAGVPPPFARPPPPLLATQPGELRWLHPQLPHLVRWDHSMGQQQQPSLSHLHTLLTEARTGPLLPTQQQQVLDELDADEKLVLSLNLSPPSLPDLVEHNPAISFEILVRLIGLGRGEGYLPSLVSMEVSLHSMEVINRLSMAASLPPEFVHLYISNCIRSCQAAQEDKYVQTRRVRLVCVFLQSLIRNRIIDVHDLSYEVQTFCIEFSRVREAAALFRMLKSLENGSEEAGGET